MVSHCKARNTHMKQLVKARQSLSASHSMYLSSLQGTGSALLHFATNETILHHHRPPLVEIVKEVNQNFLVAANACDQLSRLLEISTAGNTILCSSWQPSLWLWGSSSKLNVFGNSTGEHLIRCNNGGSGVVNNIGGGGSHCSTVERLYTWEKKLYQEVKNADTIKAKQEKKVRQLQKLEMKKVEYMKIETTKKEVEKLESLMMVSSQAIESTSNEIIKLRETELYPQLIQLVQGLMYMWRSMHESHQVQAHIVQQLNYLNTIPSNEPTPEMHRQATLELELAVQKWHKAFCSLVKAQRDYIQSLTSWLRLSLLQYGNSNPLTRNNHESRNYSFCEEWKLALKRIPDKVASEGIKKFLLTIHSIVVQQAKEREQKKKSDSVSKDFEKKARELRAAEIKYNPFSVPDNGNNNPVAQKKLKADTLKRKAEEEKSKHSKSVRVTRAMTLNNLQMGFPTLFQAMAGFSGVCKQAMESIYNQATIINQEHEPKGILL